jgi:hypothetical protein
MKKLIPLLLLSLLVFISCDDDKKPAAEYASCDMADAQPCEAGSTCVGIGEGETVCLDICDPADPSNCGETEVCALGGAGSFTCIPSCSVSENGCENDWACIGVDGDTGVCRQTCTLDGTDCDNGNICIAVENGVNICAPTCNPDDIVSCDASKVCELRTDGNYGCYDPVFINGMVFDSSSLESIEDAHIMGVDKMGVSVSSIEITDVDGNFALQVPVTRDASGTPIEGVFTLRASAQDYVDFPAGIRPAIPIDASLAVYTVGQWNIGNSSTDIALIMLPPDQQGLPKISGQVVVDSSSLVSGGGVLVVSEATGIEVSPVGFTDKFGYFTIFNVPANDYVLKGYKAFLQLEPLAITVAATDVVDLEIFQSDKELGVISGTLNIVNGGDGTATSVVLVPESTFNESFGKGIVPAGLRAPAPPQTPSIVGAYEIQGVPDGTYVVLAAFENDYLIRDPDPNIAGTGTVYQSVPFEGSYTITIPVAFKVTGALTIIQPGATAPELVQEPVKFVFKDDSSEDTYTIILYNAYGDEVWRNEAINDAEHKVDANIEYTYDGSPLEAGMYYQFRAFSIKSGDPISSTEDLLGVFHIENVANK